MLAKRPTRRSAAGIDLDVPDDERVADPKRDVRSTDSATAATALDDWVVKLLACPVDRSAVRLDRNELVCSQCGRRYPVKSGIPRMLPDQMTGEQKF